MTRAKRNAHLLAASMAALLGVPSYVHAQAPATELVPPPPAPQPPLPLTIPPPVPETPGIPRTPDSRLTGATPPEGGGRVFEQLPSFAYPEGKGRGLYGGSLWFSPSFNGLQWPYMPRTGMGFSGYVWLDPGYARFNTANSNAPDFRRYLQQGRFVLRVTPTYSNGSWFIQGQGEIVLNKEQQNAQPVVADADDIFVRAGYWNKFDIQLGRFDVWEVYHLGMGLDLNTLERGGASTGVADLYGVNFTSYKEAGSAKNTGNLAFHWYPTGWLRGESLGQIGGGDGYNVAAGRQALIFDMGWLKLKGAGEYLQRASEVVGGREIFKRWGAGGSVQVILAPFVEFGLNGAYASVKHTDNAGAMDGRGTFDLTSIGAFANARIIEDLLVGVGINRVDKTDEQVEMTVDPQGVTTRRHGEFAHMQSFVAVQYLLAKQLFLKGVFGYAESYHAPTFSDLLFNNELWSARLRATYLF